MIIGVAGMRHAKWELLGYCRSSEGVSTTLRGVRLCLQPFSFSLICVDLNLRGVELLVLLYRLQRLRQLHNFGLESLYRTVLYVCTRMSVQRGRQQRFQ